VNNTGRVREKTHQPLDCAWEILFHYVILMQKWGERILSNRLLGMRVYIRIATIMVLE
jgi:hypothetical protein